MAMPGLCSCSCPLQNTGRVEQLLRLPGALLQGFRGRQWGMGYRFPYMGIWEYVLHTGVYMYGIELLVDPQVKTLWGVTVHIVAPAVLKAD